MARDLVLLSIPPSSPSGSTVGEGLGAGVWSPSPLNLPTQGVDFQTFATHAAELARILTGATGSAIAFREKGGTICRARSGQGAPRIGAPVDTTSGISRQCLDSGALLYCADTATDSRIDPEAARALGIRAVAVVPIRSNGEDGEIVGILEVFSGTPGIFSDRHLKTLHHVAILIGSAARTPGEAFLQNLNLDGEAKGQPDLALLLEREPALQAFFRNLATVFSLRRTPRSASILQEEWHYVVIDSRMPWRRFFQSVLLHVTVMAAVVGLARIWPRQISLQPRRYEHITYYPFSGAAPVLAENRPAERTPRRHASKHSQPRESTASAPDSTTASAGETQPSGSTPPPPGTQGVAIRGPRLPVAMAVPPPPGLGAASPQQPRLPAVAVVAPPPEVNGGSGSREFSESTAGVVPPPPEVKGLTQRAGLAGAYGGAAGAASIVPPPPSVDGHAGLARSGADGSNLDAKVIGPPPSIQAGAGSRGRPAMALGGAIQVVPPPPSLQGTGSYGGGERVGSLGKSGSGIVPPPPSLQSAGGRGREGHVAGLGRSGSGIVPPPPSLQGAGGAGGGARVGTLGASGSGIVPPPPSVQGTGGYGRGGTLTGSLGGSGSQVVPPPPSLRGTGTRGGGGNGIGSLVGSGIVPPPPSVQRGLGGNSAAGEGGNGLAGIGSGVVPPPPSMDTGGNSLGGGRGGSIPHASAEVVAPAASAAAGNHSEAADSSPVRDIPAPPPPPVAEKATQPTFQNVQLRVIVSAWAPPRSSYFANYEVFIAQKWLNKETPQLIKLVYVFLPYQRRLSEYGADGWKVRKLRVVRDPSCDESLMQIEWPEGADASAKSKQPGAVAEKPPDRDRPLPCYRTTADDYRRAISSR